MARILIAWELGSNYGHITQLLPIARELRRRGHSVSFAISKLSECAIWLRQDSFPFFQAPVCSSKSFKAPRSYASILWQKGFSDTHELVTLVRAWRTLIDVVSPDILILHAAPLAAFASRVLNIPRVLIGMGFDLPPPQIPFPAFRWWEKNPNDIREDSQVLTNCNLVLEELGEAPMRVIHEIFDADATWIASYPELDHYPARGKATYVGAIFVEDAGAPPSWRNDGLPKVFAYLRTEYRGWDALINALGAAQLDTFLVVPGASPHLLESCRVKGLRLVSSPAHIATARATCDAAICHASDGIVSAFLLAGKPLLLLPNHMEQLLVAKSVVQLGAGVVCAPTDDEKTLIGSLRALLNNPSYAERAQAFAAKYASVSPETTVALLAQGIENCLATRRPMNDLACQIEVLV